MNLVDLPGEIIVHFADYLTEGDVAQFLLVNRYVLAVLSDYLLKRNVRRNSVRALAWATKQERRAIAQKLIRYGADVNQRLQVQHEKLHGSTLLHFATLTKCQPMVSMLLDLGADPSLTDPEGRTALYWAFKCRDEKVIHSMTAKILDLHTFLVHRDHLLTPLHMACSTGMTTLVFEYVDMGLDVSAQDHRGRLALDHAKSFLAPGYRVTTSEIDVVLRWMRMLVALGEDSATAHEYVSRRISSSALLNRRRYDQGHTQVGWRWYEPTTLLSPTLDNASSSEMPEIADFPSLSGELHQTLSLDLSAQDVWSPAKLALSAIKNPHAVDVKSCSTSILTTDPFPSLVNSYQALPCNEPSVMAWAAFRAPPPQHDKVVEEEVVPKSKRSKRQWESLKL